jgi:hypothetical protein
MPSSGWGSDTNSPRLIPQSTRFSSKSGYQRWNSYKTIISYSENSESMTKILVICTLIFVLGMSLGLDAILQDQRVLGAYSSDSNPSTPSDNSQATGTTSGVNNTTNSSMAGSNMTNTTGSGNLTSTNPTGANAPGMSQGQSGANPTGSNIPCVAGNAC